MRRFQECPRAYYFSYYGSWGGWEPDADPLARTLYILKQLKSRHMWAGSVVHEVLEGLLRRVRETGDPRVDEEELLETRVLVPMREAFRASRDGLYLKDPKNRLGLLEHHYCRDVPAEEWKGLADGVIQAVRNFLRRGVLEQAATLAREDWLGLERLESFHVDGVPVWIRCDFVYRRDGHVVVTDWKTGKRPPSPETRQLGCYGLYAGRKWDLPPERLIVREVNVTLDREAEATLTPEILRETVEWIRGGIREMRSRLVDPEANVARIEDFPPRPSHRACRGCGFLQVCRSGREQVGPVPTRPEIGGNIFLV